MNPTDNESLPALVCDAIVEAGPNQRASLLSRLLVAVGPLALAVIADGVFAKYLLKARGKEFAISVDDATSATWTQVFDVVQYVMQADPRFVQQVWAILSNDVTTVAAVGAAVAAFAINKLAARNPENGDS